MAVIKRDIFDNLGFSHSHASELRMRADLLDAILRVVQRQNLTQKQLAVLLGDHQPNMSDLLNGKIAKFTIDKLVRYAATLGIETTVQTVELKEGQVPIQSAGAVTNRHPRPASSQVSGTKGERSRRTPAHAGRRAKAKRVSA